MKCVIKLELGLSFDSLGEAYDFYNLYLWEVGFGIWYGNRQLNADRTKSMQEIVCGGSMSTACSSAIYLYDSSECVTELRGLCTLNFVD